MKRYKKIVSVICFILVFSFLYLLIGNALYQKDPSGATVFGGFYQQEKNTNDVVYIGSSTVYAYFNTPQAFHEQGFAAYDFCSGAQPFSAAKYLIEEAEKTQDPQLYVIDLRLFSNLVEDPVYIRRVTAYMPWSLNRIAAANAMTKCMQDGERENIWDYLFVYPYFHSNWSTIGTDYKNANEPLVEYLKQSIEPKRATEVGEFEYAHKGYFNVWYDSNDWHTPITDDPAMYQTPPAPMPERQEAVLRELCEYCSKLDKPVLFTSSPSALWPEYYAQLNYAYEIVASYGLPYLDGNAAMGEMGIISDEDWFEGGHLNSYGAAKYTTYVADYLAKTYDLPDHRGDDKYASWEEEYAEDMDQGMTLATVLFHYLSTIAEDGYSGVLLWQNGAPSEKELSSLQKMGVDTWSDEYRGVVFQDGRAQRILTDADSEEIESYVRLAVANDVDANSAYTPDRGDALCLIFKDGTTEVQYDRVFYKDLERGLMTSILNANSGGNP